MRPEILKALEQADNERANTEAWLKEQGLWPPSAANASDQNDPSNILTDEQYARREQQQWFHNRLRACLEKENRFLGARDIYDSSATAITIEWGDFDAEIEIELSIYGTLAAVFIHGDNALGVLGIIERCVSSCGITRISDDEIEELQQQGLYYHLF